MNCHANAKAATFGFVLGLLLTTTALADEQTAVEANALHRPVRHARVCAGPAEEGSARCHAHLVMNDSGQVMAAVTPSGFSPSDLRSAYKVTGTGASSTIIAIVDAFGYPNAERDLGTYRTQFGLPACTTANGCFKKVNQRGVQGSYPATNTGWSQETALDLDMASAMCPGCSLLLVEADSATFQNLATAVNTAAAMGAHAISNSYGGGESGSSTFEPFYNYAGIAVTVSSGDGGFGVEFPASSPHVTAVGGTSLVRSSNSRGWSETAWSGAGSGCSTIYAKPTWQTDTGCARRTVADVSAVADPNTGVAVFGPANSRSSAWLVFGGTSVAAPLIAGIYGVNGTAVNHGNDPYRHLSSLFDVTSGSNGSCGGTYLCTAVAGYDGPTGLGTPNGIAAFGF
jgi:subtilase family serine protease